MSSSRSDVSKTVSPSTSAPAAHATSTRPALAEIVELLSSKWTMRIIWELRGAPLTFRALQQACGGVSPTVLNRRLKRLADEGLLLRDPAGGYTLTPLAAELLQIYKPLAAWAQRWQASKARAP